MRKKTRNQRQISPDIKFNNVQVAKFINQVMRDGKKSVAQKIVYNAFSRLKANDALSVFEKALENVAPKMELISRRVGGANYQIPVEVRPERRMTLAMRWILASAQNKKGKPMSVRLAQEILLASKNDGDAVRKKDNIHKMAESNRAFAHFAR